ncbi:MAG TPA: CPBP family intramembrane glutamic endopeptidase [Longimicrobiales bacterium]|nr:CPBP family intramembrane glutamic endopeptidase [Longimicrobiales bacterium]
MTRGGWLGVAAIAAIVWFNSAVLATPARLWTMALLAGLPALMMVQARHLREAGPLPRRAAYISSVISLWLLALLTWAVAWLAGLDNAALGLRLMPAGPLVAWTGGLTLAGLAVVFAFHLAGFRESGITRQLVPVTAAEKRMFLGVSVTAGICEEFVFRGFLLSVLITASGSPGLALLLSSGVFGIVHAYQQPAGALRAAVLGALLAAPLLAHDSILPAILAHALIDVIAGLWLARYLMR